MAKERDVDMRVGQTLTQFMQHCRMTDAAFAKHVGAALPTVATWRHGTKPYPRWHAALQRITGWDWSQPDTLASLTAADITDAANRFLHTLRTPVVQYTAPSEMTFASIVMAKDALEAGRLDPSVIQLCAAMLDEAFRLRIEADQSFRSAAELRAHVMGHSNPSAALDFLCKHVDPAVFAQVRASLPTLETEAHAQV